MEHTGYIPSPKDKRDYKLSAVQATLDVIPEVFRPDYSYLPTYHQHKQPSCIGHAITWMINYNEWTEIQAKDPLSPRFIYALAKSADGIPHIDGTHYRVGLKQAQRYGVCGEPFFPNNTDLDRETYNNAKLIDSNAFEDAEYRKIKSYVKVDDTSFYSLKQAIYQNKVVLLAIGVGDQNTYTDRFGNVSWKERDVLPLRPYEKRTSGHAIIGIGYDKDYIYFQNSWGTTWGQYGVGYFGKNYIKHVEEAWTIIDLPNDVIKKLKEAQLSLIDKLKLLIADLMEKIKTKGRAASAFFRE